MSGFRWSPHQEAILAAGDGGSSFGIEAVAGSGKTALLAELSRRSGAAPLLVAFNREAKVELESRLKRARIKGSAVTSHSLGLRLLRENGLRPAVDRWKYSRLAGLHLADEPTSIRRMAVALVEDVQSSRVGWARPALVKRARGLLLDQRPEDELADESRTRARQLDAQAAAAAEAAALLLDHGLRDLSALSFGDMLFAPVALELSPRREVGPVFIDEAQDLSRLQHRLLEILSPDRVVAVGDRMQAIYTWRGAHPQSMPELGARLGFEDWYPQPVSYRVPLAVAELARAYVPAFEARPGAPEGDVLELPADDVARAQVGDLVVARSRRNVAFAARALRAVGKPARVIGADPFTEAKALLASCKGRTNADARARILGWLERIEGFALELDDPRRAVEARETAETALGLLGDGLVSEALEELRRLQARDVGPAVLISTVHGAKGLEADRVWAFEDFLSDEGEEARLRYVAVTRAKLELRLLRHEEEA